MNTLATLAQLIVAVTIVIVWVFRFDNIVNEFNHFGLSVFTRSAVGAAKISLATLLVAGIWYPCPVAIPAILMGALMICAQFYHSKVNNPFKKRLPALAMLILCAFIAANGLGVFAK